MVTHELLYKYEHPQADILADIIYNTISVTVLYNKLHRRPNPNWWKDKKDFLWKLKKGVIRIVKIGTLELLLLQWLHRRYSWIHHTEVSTGKKEWQTLWNWYETSAPYILECNIATKLEMAELVSWYRYAQFIILAS